MGLHSITLLGDFPAEDRYGLDKWAVIPLRCEDRFRSAYARLPFDIKIVAEQHPDALSVIKQSGNAAAQEGLVVFNAVANFGRDLIPLTPWMVLHRLSHALDMQRTRDVNPHKKIAAIFTELFRAGGRDEQFNYDVGYIVGTRRDEQNERRTTAMLSALCTMRSARTLHDMSGQQEQGRPNGFTTHLDVFPELFAQFGIRGGVKFRQPDFLKPVDLLAYEARVDAVLAEAAAAMVGKVYVF